MLPISSTDFFVFRPIFNRFPIDSNIKLLSMEEVVESSIHNLWPKVRDISLCKAVQVDHLVGPPTPLHLFRHYAALNKPCLISTAISHWPTLLALFGPPSTSSAHSSSPLHIPPPNPHWQS